MCLNSENAALTVITGKKYLTFLKVQISHTLNNVSPVLQIPYRQFEKRRTEAFNLLTAPPDCSLSYFT